MKFKSPILASVSGSIGGAVGSHNRFGNYLRARAIPVNPSSAAQVNIRAIFGNLSTAWQGLSPAQRDAWTTYAINVPVVDSLGDSIVLTGNQMFVRCNTARMQAGLLVVNDGPIVFSNATLTPISVTASAAADALSITFDDTDDWATELDGGLLIYGSRQKSPTIKFFKGPYTFTALIAGAVGPPPVTPAVETSLHALDVGNDVFVRAVAVRADGRISPVQFVSNIEIAV